jgi:hypothetical protein
MLTTDQLDQVSRVVEAAISKARNSTPAEPADNVQTLDKDPAMSQADEAEAALLKQLANPKFMMVRGRRGTRLINVTQQSLDAIRNWKQERTQFGNTIAIK